MKQKFRFKVGDIFKYKKNEILIIGKIISIKGVYSDIEFKFKSYTNNLITNYYPKNIPIDIFYYNSLMYNNSKILTKQEYMLEVL